MVMIHGRCHGKIRTVDKHEHWFCILNRGLFLCVCFYEHDTAAKTEEFKKNHIYITILPWNGKKSFELGLNMLEVSVRKLDFIYPAGSIAFNFNQISMKMFCKLKILMMQKTLV